MKKMLLLIVIILTSYYCYGNNVILMLWVRGDNIKHNETFVLLENVITSEQTTKKTNKYGKVEFVVNKNNIQLIKIYNNNITRTMIIDLTNYNKTLYEFVVVLQNTDLVWLEINDNYHNVYSRNEYSHNLIKYSITEQ